MSPLFPSVLNGLSYGGVHGSQLVGKSRFCRSISRDAPCIFFTMDMRNSQQLRTVAFAKISYFKLSLEHK
jgi:hypothetical protein